MQEPHYAPEVVFMGCREECQEYMQEAYEDTVGCVFMLKPTGRIVW
jgi:hypothetical protein